MNIVTVAIDDERLKRLDAILQLRQKQRLRSQAFREAIDLWMDAEQKRTDEEVSHVPEGHSVRPGDA